MFLLLLGLTAVLRPGHQGLRVFGSWGFSYHKHNDAFRISSAEGMMKLGYHCKQQRLFPSQKRLWLL